MDLSETFWLTLMATGAPGVIGLIIKKMSQPKCDEINCWGVKIHRRFDLEMNDDSSEEDKSSKGIKI